MEELTKEKLNKLLETLRNDNKNDDIYHHKKRFEMMAMCYSQAMKIYECVAYKGKHTCSTCGQKYGNYIYDLIKKCKAEKYKAYEKSNDISVLKKHPCYNKCLKELAGYPYRLAEILDKTDNSITIKSDKEQIPGIVYNFDKKISFDEWDELCSNCYIKQDEYGFEDDKRISPCFDYDKEYETYENLVEEFKNNNINVELRYNCPECVANGAKELELWIEPNKDISIVTYPYLSSVKSENADNYYVHYSEYKLALEFLKGNNSYRILKDNDYTKLDIDITLNKVLNFNITYNCEEVDKTISSFVNDNIINQENLEEKKVYETLITEINELFKNKQNVNPVAIKETENIIEYIAGYYEYANMDCNYKKDIIICMVKNALFGGKEKVNKEIVFDVIKSIYEDDNSYEYEITYDLFNDMYDKFGNDFGILPENLFNILDKFKEIYREGVFDGNCVSVKTSCSKIIKETLGGN